MWLGATALDSTVEEMEELGFEPGSLPRPITTGLEGSPDCLTACLVPGKLHSYPGACLSAPGEAAPSRPCCQPPKLHSLPADASRVVAEKRRGSRGQAHVTESRVQPSGRKVSQRARAEQRQGSPERQEPGPWNPGPVSLCAPEEATDSPAQGRAAD